MAAQMGPLAAMTEAGEGKENTLAGKSFEGGRTDSNTPKGRTLGAMLAQRHGVCGRSSVCQSCSNKLVTTTAAGQAETGQEPVIRSK
jgi:hypothetical protein